MTAAHQQLPIPSPPGQGAQRTGRAEWLLTDGLGGYACGTASDLPTRRYHSWLTVRRPDATRLRVLHGVEEVVVEGAGSTSLLAAHWAALPHPSDRPGTVEFRSEPSPTWTYRLPGGAVLERSLWMRRGHAGVLARWRNLAAASLRLRLRPLLCLEDADHLQRERPLSARFAAHERGFDLAHPDASAPLQVRASRPCRVHEQPVWYRDFHFAEERARGYDSEADRYAPCVLEFELGPGEDLVCSFALDESAAEPAALLAAARAEREALQQWASLDPDPLAKMLRAGAQDYFYRDAAGRLGVLAGFPWFGEWGRDVFLALPGLSLAVDEPGRGLEVLRGALPFLRNGLLPNIYGRSPAESHYGSADAALWFALCVQRFSDHGPELGALMRAEFASALAGIAESCLEGTELGLFVDREFLLCAGAADRNATWMDAQTSAGPVTPRDGQPVEIVALWCALLRQLAEWQGGKWRKLADAAGESFVRRFWRQDLGCLYDCVRDGVPDLSVRPNMTLAAALRRSPLSTKQRRGVVEATREFLLTPFGLRTLAPDDARYQGRYEGSCERRDAAYHQGTVWPWLLGFYVEARLRACKPGALPQERRDLRASLRAFLPQPARLGFGHVGEVYDGDAPHRPGGTFAQAWSSGELLRALRLCREDGGSLP